MSSDFSNSEINQIIPPEIKNDEFYNAIKRIAQKEDINNVLEIGSSSGQGSTEAFVTGLKQNPNKPTLFCLEVSKPRFAELQKRYVNETFVKCYNLSSISLNQFPDETDVLQFYQNTTTNLNYYPRERILSWLRQDVEYVKNSGVADNGIEKIKKENSIDFFDAVLIDGSEFTGSVEFEQIYGAKFIFLDDINSFKNYSNHQKLIADRNYRLLEQNQAIRNGYSIFERVNKVELFDFEEEKYEQLLVRNLVSPGMTVFDIGANLGDYSLLFSKLVGHSGKVYSFEPTWSTFQKLQDRISKSKSRNIKSFQKAVFSENTRIEFNEFSEEYSVWNSVGKPQMLDQKGLTIPIVKTEIVEAITVDSVCQAHNIEAIDYLKIDVEGAESDVLLGAKRLLTKKAIRFIQFEISQKMLEGLNRKAQETFDILIENGYECHRIERDGQIGQRVNDSKAFYENYIAFPELPVHFFTIVLNGQPFIRYHIDVFKELPFRWHWHIVEGVADLKHDTSWSLALGGSITDELHQNGCSNDGTTQYLDELARLYPDNVTVYRQSEGVFWDGKLEMVNAPLVNIQEECLLWQVDVDEFWTVEQLCAARLMFIANPEKTAAFYWCWYFVGEDLVISTRNCYAQNPKQEWLRTWRFKPGATWAAHEPPILVEPLQYNQWHNVAEVNPFLHQETEERGLIFQHFAYVIPKQLQFKEQYYGYKNAVAQWSALQKQTRFPVLLREYFPWVRDETMATKAQDCGLVPIAQKDLMSGSWKFLQPEELQKQAQEHHQTFPTIIVDGVFFQLYRTGIARVWHSLLEEWVENGFANYVIVLDRAGTAPKISGIRYRLVPAYYYNNIENDREMLQQVCEAEAADLFISTYYTTPLSTPSVLMLHDMIPEIMGHDPEHPNWRGKHHAIQHASAYVAVSENTARDLVKFFPETSLKPLVIAPNGVKPVFAPASDDTVSRFKTQYGISKPYFLLVGAGSGYKNSILFFKAFSQLCSRQGFEIVCTGSGGFLEAEFRACTLGSMVHMLQLSDDELIAAYSGALALVYPSLYEGFGLPVLEALACGCPVITCPNASIPEVAGVAALYVKDDDLNGLANALCEVQKPDVRQALIAKGLEQAKKFSWSEMARTISSVLIDVTLESLKLKDVNLIIFPDWSQPEESLSLELEHVIRAITEGGASHVERTLLVDTRNGSGEEANLLLSGIVLNFLMQEDLDVSEKLEISLVENLGEIQWEALLPRIRARIALDHENPQAIAQFDAKKIPACKLDSFELKNFLKSKSNLTN